VGIVFLGEHQHTLDGKGRVILPARFRDRLTGGVVLTIGEDRCIDVFPHAEYERQVRRLQEEVEDGLKPMSRLRMFSARAFEEVPDGQGRVTIPAKLRAYARLDRELTVNGAVSKIEIWDRAAWEAYEEQAEAAFADGDDQ
jgi:MraZ protein